MAARGGVEAQGGRRGGLRQLAVQRLRMEWIRSNPGTFAGLVALRAFHFWFPPGLNAVHTVLEWSLTLVSMIGLYLLYFRHRAAALLILGIWLFYPPVYYIMLWSSRYRYPINWTLLLTAAIALKLRGLHGECPPRIDARGVPVNLHVKLLADYYVGGTLQAMLKPPTVLLRQGPAPRSRPGALFLADLHQDDGRRQPGDCVSGPAGHQELSTGQATPPDHDFRGQTLCRNPGRVR